MEKSFVNRLIKAFLVICCLALPLSGCGNGGSSKSAYDGDSINYAGDGENFAEDADGADYGTQDKDLSNESTDVSESGSQEKSSDSQNEETTSKLKKEMLVYRGNVSIDTLEFDKSVSVFKKLLEKAGGFVETESYSDDGSYSDYYIDETEDRHNTYTATVRVPSSKYDGLMNDAGSLGDVRKKSSNAENVTQKYSTYQSELQVYQTQYDRYLKLLKEAKNDETALKLQDKLFELQIKIADIKAGITNIETDVSYSYIDIVIREVRKYQDEPVQTDTFWQRLKYTCVDSWRVFLRFMEGLLFLVIRLWYYIVIILVILPFIRKLRKKMKDKREEKKKKMSVRIAPNGMIIENPMGNVPNGMGLGSQAESAPNGMSSENSTEPVSNEAPLDTSNGATPDLDKKELPSESSKEADVEKTQQKE